MAPPAVQFTQHVNSGNTMTAPSRVKNWLIEIHYRHVQDQVCWIFFDKINAGRSQHGVLVLSYCYIYCYICSYCKKFTSRACEARLPALC